MWTFFTFFGISAFSIIIAQYIKTKIHNTQIIANFSFLCAKSLTSHKIYISQPTKIVKRIFARLLFFNQQVVHKKTLKLILTILMNEVAFISKRFQIKDFFYDPPWEIKEGEEFFSCDRENWSCARDFAFLKIIIN